MYNNNIYTPQTLLKKNIYGFGFNSANPDYVIELTNVRVATTADLAATFLPPGTLDVPGAPAVIDTIPLAVFDRVLVKDQAMSNENGVYQVVSIAGPTVLVRLSDFQPNRFSTIIYVVEGMVNAGSLWYNVRDLNIVIGVDPITFIMISATGSGGGDITNATNLGAGDGLFAAKVGSILQFKSITAGAGIALTPSGTELNIATSGVGTITGGANVGGFAEVFQGVSGGNTLDFRTLQGSATILVTQNANDISFDTTGVLTEQEISYQLLTIPVTVSGSTVTYTKVAYFAWDDSQYSTYTNGRLTIYTVKGGSFDYEIDFLGDATATLIAGPITVSATGILEIPLTGIPVADDNLFIQVRRVANLNGVTPNSMLMSATLAFTF